MLAIFEISTVITLLTASLKNAVLTTMPWVLRRSAQGVVSQNGTHRVAHKANLSSKTFAFITLDKLVIHLIGTYHDTWQRILIIRARTRQ